MLFTMTIYSSRALQDLLDGGAHDFFRPPPTQRRPLARILPRQRNSPRLYTRSPNPRIPLQRQRHPGRLACACSWYSIKISPGKWTTATRSLSCKQVMGMGRSRRRRYVSMRAALLCTLAPVAAEAICASRFSSARSSLGGSRTGSTVQRTCLQRLPRTTLLRLQHGPVDALGEQRPVVGYTVVVLARSDIARAAGEVYVRHVAFRPAAVARQADEFRRHQPGSILAGGMDGIVVQQRQGRLPLVKANRLEHGSIIPSGASRTCGSVH